MKLVLFTDDLILVQAPHVHIPDSYSEYLASTIDVTGARTACDLTAGCGYQTLKLAKCGLHVVAVDLLPEAVELTLANAATNELTGQVDARVGNLYGALCASERFDLIVAWPPVMPTPDEQLGNDWWSVANDGGRDGRMIFDQVITGAAPHLSPGGSLWMPHPWFLAESETRHLANASGLDAEVVGSKKFSLGAVSGSRLGYIQGLGFEPEMERGTPVQRLSIIRFRSRPSRSNVA